MKKLFRWPNLVFLITLFLVFSYQACLEGQFRGSGESSGSSGGSLNGGDSEIFTGAIYVRDLAVNRCADGSDLTDRVDHNFNSDSFILRLRDCQQIVPVVINKANIQLLGPNAEMLVYDGEIYRGYLPEQLECLKEAEFYYKNILAADVIVADLVDNGAAATIIADAEAYRDDWQRKFDALSCRDLYLSSRDRTSFSVVVDQDTTNLVLRDELINRGWDGQSDVKVLLSVEEGVTLSSDSTARPALNVVGLTPNSQITVVNRGFIVGKGGRGGPLVDANGEKTQDGEDGGTAVYASVSLSLYNSGIIAGGGGGGAGGRRVSCQAGGGEGGTYTAYSMPNGGGGGAGGGEPGVSGSGRNTNGQPGEMAAPGRGGRNSGNCGYGVEYSVGATGGELGQPGGDMRGGALGGKAGKSIRGAEFIEWKSMVGSVLGPQINWND